MLRGCSKSATPASLSVERWLVAARHAGALLLQRPLKQARHWLQRWRDHDDPLFHPRPPLNGADLQQALDLRPSPRLGALLDHLTAERAFGRLRDREQALDAARRWLSSRADRR